VKEEILKILGDDSNSSKQLKIDFQPELVTTWTKWTQEGLPEKTKESILELYPRKGVLFTEAPKVNLEVVSVLSEIAVKKDKHFLETQNTVGSALSALGAAISMVLNRESDEIDQEKFLEYLSHTGQLLTDVFFQQSVARKSFITPLLYKTIKPAIDASKTDEWLYGKNFTEQVKEAKTIEKTIAGIKAADKQATKSTWGYQIPFKEPPYQDTPPPEYHGNDKDLEITKSEINKLLKIGAIEPCEPTPGQFLSSFFTIPKPDGSYRFIINLKNLNKFIDLVHFKMEDIRAAKQLVMLNAYLGSMDLKDAFYMIPIHKNFKKYLRFLFLGKLFQFTCLQCGLCISPYIFTKIMKPVMNYLRRQGILLIIYLDDILIMDLLYERCLRNINKVIKILERLGLIINYNKSSLIPQNKCKYLGFNINTKYLTLELTDKKKNQIISLLRNLKIGNRYKIREIAHILGVLVAACPAVAYGPVYRKRLEREKFLALTINGNNYEANMLVKEELAEDITWWIQNAQIGINPIRTQQFTLEIFSDSSLKGWGAHCEKKSVFGFWSHEERRHHINYLELLAASFALKCFASHLSGKEILLRLDNTTAIAYVNKMGGIQFPHLSELVRKIWLWCEDRTFWVVASYIPSKEDVEADAASRITNMDTEWELSHKHFNKIQKKFGPFTIDLFASRINKKCKTFCSRFADPEASFALRKIIIDRAEGVMIVPEWSTQPWYPLFNSLLIEPPLILEPNDNLLISPCRSKKHPLASNLSLLVGKLSWRALSGGD
ncbi:GSCOCG00006046001-RA-CDS, partial [Cotesia congregata]